VKPVTPSVPSRDSSDLASFGYRQRLDRTLGGFSSFAAGFSYLSILTGLPLLFYLGYGAGGPAFFWAWPAVFVGQLLVALCFAELAAAYPLSGGVYQWAKQTGPDWVGWMAGWVYLACAGITLASVALALQATLPRIAPWTQAIGDAADPSDAARNAVLLGCILIAFSTLVNSLGVRLLATINNIGVFAELTGAVLLIVLLVANARRAPWVILDTQGRGLGLPLGYLAPFLAAALTPSYVMYGFDSAGSLAEETDDPRRRAPRAIIGSLVAVGLTGAVLILAACLAAPDLHDVQLGEAGGGFGYLVERALGRRVSLGLLAIVAVAVTVCTLTVHAAAVRLIFSMARDNTLPFSEALARIPESSKTPVLPAVLLGAGAMVVLALNVDFPQVRESMACVAVAWAHLAYLFVTVPMLVRRCRRETSQQSGGARKLFALGRFGFAVNLVAVIWGVLVVVNVGWPRAEIYGEIWYRRYIAPLSTLALLGLGAVYYVLVHRQKAEVLESHRATLVAADVSARIVQGEVG
jgi:urea carboxylase system permease